MPVLYRSLKYKIGLIRYQIKKNWLIKIEFIILCLKKKNAVQFLNNFFENDKNWVKTLNLACFYFLNGSKSLMKLEE